jgi:uncharacterized membrane protein
MPTSVGLFEKIAYLAFVLGVASVAINYPVTRQMPGATTTVIVVIQSVSVALQLLFIRWSPGSGKTGPDGHGSL